MNILVLVDELHKAGGLERSLAIKADAWSRAGHNVTVLTLDAPQGDFFPLAPSIARLSLGVRYNRSEPLLAPQNVFSSLRHLWRLWRFLWGGNYDVIVNSGYGFDFYFLPLLRRSGTLIVKENHSSRYFLAKDSLGVLGSVKWRVRQFFESMYDFVLFLSKEEAALSNLHNCRVIPNAIRALRLQGGVPRKRQHVIAAGRICHVKGFDRLVDAWALAATRIPGWSLHIYGDGEPHDVAELEAQITRYGLCDRVKLWPATSEIQARMAESAIYAMTSRSECFPMVLLEAMQLGLPVVAFDCPTGPRNIVQHEVTGRLIADGDVHAFSAALVSLALDFDARARMGRASREVARRYEVEQVMSAWEALFNDKP